MLAAFLLSQIENMEKITARRQAIFLTYARLLAPLVERGLVRIAQPPQHCTGNYHMFYVLTADIEERTALIGHLRNAGILAVFHYVPLHSSPFARSLGVPQTSLAVTDASSSRLVRLPMYFDLSEREATEVAEAVLDFYSNREAPTDKSAQTGRPAT
jgi:dTDP-4-amino-4,6-dideoxygalactose transaminase